MSIKLTRPQTRDKVFYIATGFPDVCFVSDGEGTGHTEVDEATWGGWLTFVADELGITGPKPKRTRKPAAKKPPAGATVNKIAQKPAAKKAPAKGKK